MDLGGAKWADNHNFSAGRFFEIVGSFKTLKELEIGLWPSLLREEDWLGVPFYKLLERLPNLEGLGLRGMSILLRNSFLY